MKLVKCYPFFKCSITGINNLVGDPIGNSILRLEIFRTLDILRDFFLRFTNSFGQQLDVILGVGVKLFCLEM